MYQVTQLTKHIFYHCSYLNLPYVSSDPTHQAYLQPLQLPKFTLRLHQVTQLTKHIFNHCSYLHLPYVYIEWPNSPSISSTIAVTYIYPTFTSSDPTHQAYLQPLQLPTFTLRLHRVTELTKHIFYHCSYLHLPNVYIKWPNSPSTFSTIALTYIPTEWPNPPSISSTTAVTYIYPTFISSDPHTCHPCRQLNNQIPVLAMSLQSVTKLADKKFPTAVKPPCPTPDLNTHTSDSHSNNLPVTCWYFVWLSIGGCEKWFMPLPLFFRSYIHTSDTKHWDLTTYMLVFSASIHSVSRVLLEVFHHSNYWQAPPQHTHASNIHTDILPVTCWYFVRPSMECMAWPNSWKRFSIMPGVRRVGVVPVGAGRFSCSTTTGSW